MEHIVIRDSGLLPADASDLRLESQSVFFYCNQKQSPFEVNMSPSTMHKVRQHGKLLLLLFENIFIGILSSIVKNSFYQ
jgi:hypothetical protein